jgi:hypothetical protein
MRGNAVRLTFQVAVVGCKAAKLHDHKINDLRDSFASHC